jgi:pyruvate/2-oxoacid:ferredoxin oxidoreductase alpha subunit
MGSVNSINKSADQTIKLFDQFYGYQQNVAANDYDAVLSYFLSVFGSPEAATNFTVSLFRVANQSNIPVMTLLQQFQGKTKPQITLQMTYFLNGVRSASTLLGINVPTQPNYYIAHNIRI